MIDLHFVIPGLAVGSRFPAEAVARLAAEHGIARVVDVRGEACDDEALLRSHGIRLLHLPTEDTCAVSQERLGRGVAFVSEALDRGERVLIHCQYGIGRSALLALCVLVSRGDSPLRALERTKQARGVISPSPAQLEALRAYAADLKAKRGTSWAVPSLGELGAIAWRHLIDDGELDLLVAEAASTRAS